MSNQLSTTGDDNVEYAWMHLDDWTPGLYDKSYVATDTPLANPAPINSGDPSETWCCTALPSGGLAPLPNIAEIKNFPDAFPGTATLVYLTVMTGNPTLDSGGIEIIYAWEADDGTDHYFNAFSYLPDHSPSPAHNNIETITAPSYPGYFGAPFPMWTRMGGATPPTSPGPGPRLVFPTSILTDSNGLAGHLFVYPQIATPTLFAVDDLITNTGTQETGQIVGYDGRVIVLQGVSYPWPISNSDTNENVSFTDPPQSNVLGTQQALFSPETPFGYGAMGSISNGELIIIKKHLGAVQILGDIDSPSSVLFLPGVQPVGGIYGRADSTPIGLVYCSQDQGAWVWNGGNLSSKLSNQVHDSFFDVETNVIASNNFGFFVKHWGSFILFSGNYIFNLDTNSWWKLYPLDGAGDSNNPGRTFFHFTDGQLTGQVWASPLVINTAGESFLYKFDNIQGTPHYQFQSLPIDTEQNSFRVIDIRNAIIVAQQPNGTGTITLSFLDNTGVVWNETITVNSTRPKAYRLNVGVRGAQNITYRINSDNATSSEEAPTIISLDVALRARARQPAQD